MCWGTQNWSQHSWVWIHQCWVEEKDHLHSPAGNALPDAGSGHHWPFLQEGCVAGSCSRWWPPGPPSHFLPSCFPAGWPPSLYRCLGLFLPRYRTCYFPLLNVKRFLPAHLSSLSRSLCMAAWPSGTSTIPPSFLSSADLLQVCSSPSSRSLSKKLKWDWIRYWSLSYTISYWPPTRHHVTDHHPQSLAIQACFGPSYCLLIQPVLHQLLC